MHCLDRVALVGADVYGPVKLVTQPRHLSPTTYESHSVLLKTVNNDSDVWLVHLK